MPFAGFQGMVNGWIKVNSKNVVINNITNEPADANMRRDGISQGHSNASSSARDSESSAIKRFNNRRHNRKLERTVSLTDLLREMAMEKETEQQKLGKETSSKASSGSQTPTKNEPQTPASVPDGAMKLPDFQLGALKDDQSDSLRFVAGFFAGEIPLLPPPPLPPASISDESKPAAVWHPRIAAASASHHQAVASNVSKQQYPQSATHRRTTSNGASVGSPSRPGMLLRTDSMGSSKGDDSHHNPLAPPASLRSTPPLFPPRGDDSRSKQHPQNPMQQFFKHFPNPGGKRCGSCEEYEQRLIAMSTDMEYLRSAALQNEYVCRECQNEESSLHSKESLLRLTEASARLSEIEKRHLERIEELTEQASQLQVHMQNKLSRFATIAKELNEQSSLRYLEVIKLDQELLKVKAERDSLVIEVQQLRAAVAHHNVERKEHQLLKEILVKYEIEGLEQAKDIIAQRDGVIRDLTCRLEKAMETIDLERRTQRQRRQIIFPARAAPVVYASSLGHAEFVPSTEEFAQAREQARSAEIRLENALGEAARSEAAYRARIAILEARLAAVES